jgi:SnoaL-like domain
MGHRRDIKRLSALYSQLLDDGRIEEWAELFTEDAVFSVWGNTYEGRTAIREGIGGMSPERPGKHVAFATVIDLAPGKNPKRALAWTDFIALADAGEGQWGRAYSIATAARYYDELVRDETGWRFQRRAIRMAGDPLPEGSTESPAR